MTNQEKKNIYNAIQNLYNMDFKTWQEVLSMLYNLVADVNQKFDTFESKFEINLGSEVTYGIKKLHDDGKLDEIINAELLNEINNTVNDINNNVNEFKDDIHNSVNEFKDDIHNSVNEFKDDIYEQLDNIETESVSKIQKVNNAYRSFKPFFGHCVDWSSVGGNNTWSEERILTEINELVSYGVEKLSVTIQTKCINGSVALISDLDRFKKCLDYANKKGLETTTIKVHCNQFRKAIKSGEYDNVHLKAQWLSLIRKIANYFQGYCEYFVAINEGENLFSSEHEDFLIECLEIGKSKGFKCGFTPSSKEGWDNLPNAVQYKCDFIAFNCYPSISLKGLDTSFEDVKNAFDTIDLNNWINNHKKKFNKPIIISEIGCEDRKSCLACTYVWDFGNGEEFNNGKVQQIMLKGIFEYLKNNDNLDSLYYWFPFRGDNVINTINYYIGGGNNE